MSSTDEQHPPAPQPAPGWYPDTATPGQQRYWDGTAWTTHVHPDPNRSHDATAGSATPTQVPFWRVAVRAVVITVVVFFGVVAILVTGGRVLGSGGPSSEQQKWIEVLRERAEKCGLAQDRNPGLDFDQATYVPREDLAIGNTGEHPDASYHFVEVPIVSENLPADYDETVLFDMFYDEQYGYVINSDHYMLNQLHARCFGGE